MATVKEIRAVISQLGGSEIKAVATDENLKELFAQKQLLYAEMNTAKRLAAEQAAKPFLDAIAQIDKDYAFLLRFIGDNKGTE